MLSNVNYDLWADQSRGMVNLLVFSLPGFADGVKRKNLEKDAPNMPERDPTNQTFFV